MNSSIPLGKGDMFPLGIQAAIGSDRFHHVHLVSEMLETESIGHDVVDMSDGRIRKFSGTNYAHGLILGFLVAMVLGDGVRNRKMRFDESKPVFDLNVPGIIFFSDLAVGLSKAFDEWSIGFQPFDQGLQIGQISLEKKSVLPFTNKILTPSYAG